MFKYVAALVIIMVCLVLLQYGCKGMGERWHQRMEEYRERRKEKIEDRRERRQERWHREDSIEDGDSQGGDRKHWFRRRRHGQDSAIDEITIEEDDCYEKLFR